MKPTTEAPLEHTQIWELLPWFVNGRLDDTERARVEAHQRECGACRDEIAVQRRICAAFAVQSPVEQIPAASLNKLRQRLDKAGTSETERDRAGHEKLPVVRAPASWIRAAPIAAALVMAALIVGIPAVRYWHHAGQGGDSSTYQTVSKAAPQHPRTVIRAVFAPTVTLKELQGLLDDAGLSIVSGPTEAGVYSLAMNGSESAAWSLQRLRAHDSVRFAETITPLPAEPP